MSSCKVRDIPEGWGGLKIEGWGGTRLEGVGGITPIEGWGGDISDGGSAFFEGHGG